MAMTKTDKKELEKLVKSRFEMLRAQVVQREVEIANRVRNKIWDDHEEALKSAKKDYANAVKAYNRAIEALNDVVRGADAKGLAYQHRLPAPMELDIGTEFGVKGVEERVRAEMRRIQEESGFARVSLRGKELELVERLIVDNLESEEARSFLDRIPTVDTLLPLPNGNGQKAIEQG